MKRNNLRTRMLAVFVMAALAGALRFGVIQAGVTHAARMQRMIDRSKSLYEIITFSRQTDNLTCEESVSGSRDGSPISHLIVSINKETEPSGVRMDWDSRTGELMHIWSESHVPEGAELPVMRQEEAADTTAWWLRILGITSKAQRWKLTTAPEHSSNGYVGSYTARWRGANWEVIIRIQDQTGELLRADIRRLE